MTRLVRILLILVLFPALLSVVAGWMGAPGFLHPEKRVFTADMVRDADVTFAQIGARREDFDVRAPDGVTLRGWKVRTAKPNGAWVLVFHGVADNRYGTEEHARMLLQRGYGVVMMDSRAHGASGGEMASYGWLERKDVSAAIDELINTERPEHIFALGNSMGAGIAHRFPPPAAQSLLPSNSPTPRAYFRVGEFDGSRDCAAGGGKRCANRSGCGG